MSTDQYLVMWLEQHMHIVDRAGEFMSAIMDTISSFVNSIFVSRRENMHIMETKMRTSNNHLLIAVFAVLLVLVTRMFFRSDGRRTRKLLPPGPRPWPLVGNLFLLGPHPHLVFARLAQRYGSVMSVFIGSIRVVIVSDATTARELFSAKDANFASRPVRDLMYTAATNLNLGDAADTVSFFISAYGPRVREVRQLVLSAQKLEANTGALMAEVQRMVMEFAACGENLSVEVRPVVSEFALRNSCRALFNKAFLQNSTLHPGAYREWETVNTKILGEHNLCDIIPALEVLRKLDVQGLNAKWKYVNELKVRWTSSVLEWYRNETPSSAPATDLTETLVRLGEEGKYSDDAIKSIVADVLSAGAESTGTTLEWTLLELVRHPHVMERLQAEIDAAFGEHRVVEEDEAAQLPYLQAVVKEVLRFRAPGVLGMPHCNAEDDTLGGYHIPAGTAVFVNLWMIHRDPSTWGEDALEFNPDRFLGTDLNVNGTDYHFLPFAAGRRICPGRALAMRTLHTAVGSLVHAFEWSAVPGSEIDANEGATGVSIRPETP